MNNLKTEQIQKLVVVVLGLLSLLLIFSTLYFAKLVFVDTHSDQIPGTITVSATGEVKSIPNIATFNFAAIATGVSVDEAQSKMSVGANKAIEYLKSQGVDDKDIQTSGYSAEPQYDYSTSKPLLTNYIARENITVKVRDASKSGALLSGVGQQGASEISGLSFESDDKDVLMTQAREDAIKKAKTKAVELASQVGFKLVKIVGFNEDGQSPPGPIPYYDRAVSSQSVAPDIQVGENTISTTVTLTYEIK